MNSLILNEIIQSRRSVFLKDYNGTQIEDEVIWQILKNANWAPNHKLTEPWRFKVYTGKGLITLGKLQAETYKTRADQDGTFTEAKYHNLATSPQKASHVIAIIMKRSLEVKIQEIEEISAVACAVQNMYLTATAYGLGAYWGTGGMTYMPEANAALQLGVQDRLMGFFYLGKTDEPLKAGKRGPIEQKVEWIKSQ
ncbi:MAG: nitroreductase [Flammeovirgaceae bacterium]|jgi:nitroreductase|nr:nitroreductase [Flammeovirgaceae bacterium]